MQNEQSHLLIGEAQRNNTHTYRESGVMSHRHSCRQNATSELPSKWILAVPLVDL